MTTSPLPAASELCCKPLRVRVRVRVRVLAAVVAGRLPVCADSAFIVCAEEHGS